MNLRTLLQDGHSPARFSQRVKEYLTSRFDLGEKTGGKADPRNVEADMRRERDSNGERVFLRNDWLKESQIKGFFSRLASSRRHQRQISEDELVEFEREEEYNNLLLSVHREIGLSHPIMYYDYNLCEYYSNRKLKKLTVPLIKNMLDYFEIDYASSERKEQLLNKIKDAVLDCSCHA